MINFNDIKYDRPNYETTKKRIEQLLEELQNTDNYDEYLRVLKEIIKIQNHIEEMHDYADIKNMRNSKDAFYVEEKSFWNEYKPKFDMLFIPFYELCLNSKYIDRLKEIMPINFFNTIAFQLKLNSDEVVDLQRKENELKAKYNEIVTKKILFLGEERNLSYITGYFSNADRELRKKAHDAVNNFYYCNQSQLDTILFELINVRNEIANKLGFANYSDYSVYNLRRFGYDYSDISSFRNNVIEFFKPLCKKLEDWKKEELELEKIEYYDTIYFKEMPELLYKDNELLEKLGNLLKNIDDELYNFYKQMLENGYIDLEIRDNKINYAITNYLSETGYPVITGNFKGSYFDASMLTHEFGHAFQKYNASIKDRDYIVSALLKYPTFDIAEMFSHAMELISLNYIQDLFSTDDYKKYCFMKIYNIINNIPYICLVDEFQQIIYSKEKLNKEDIRKIWLELSEKYGLENDNQGHINLVSGGYFYRQTHILLRPFYYIDYALSYFGAFVISDLCIDNLDLFKKMGAVASYYPLNELISNYNLSNPFDRKSFEDITKLLEKRLLTYKTK